MICLERTGLNTPTILFKGAHSSTTTLDHMRLLHHNYIIMHTRSIRGLHQRTRASIAEKSPSKRWSEGYW